MSEETVAACRSERAEGREERKWRGDEEGNQKASGAAQRQFSFDVSALWQGGARLFCEAETAPEAPKAESAKLRPL